MRRAAFAVLVIPYALDSFAEVAFALCRRRGDAEDWWHVPAGRGARAETPIATARRHAAQLSGVPDRAAFLALDSRATLTIDGRSASCGLAEHAFAVRADPVDDLRVPDAYEQLWVSYEIADGLLRRDAERNALWELARRLGLRRACR